MSREYDPNYSDADWKDEYCHLQENPMVEEKNWTPASGRTLAGTAELRSDPPKGPPPPIAAMVPPLLKRVEDICDRLGRVLGAVRGEGNSLASASGNFGGICGMLDATHAKLTTVESMVSELESLFVPAPGPDEDLQSMLARGPTPNRPRSFA